MNTLPSFQVRFWMMSTASWIAIAYALGAIEREAAAIRERLERTRR